MVMRVEMGTWSVSENPPIVALQEPRVRCLLWIFPVSGTFNRSGLVYKGQSFNSTQSQVSLSCNPSSAPQSTG